MMQPWIADVTRPLNLIRFVVTEVQSEAGFGRRFRKQKTKVGSGSCRLSLLESAEEDR